jgi:sugar/nucleoside kinase (ribokinase family)
MNRAIVEKDSDVVELFNYEMNTENMFVTIGAHGVIYTDGKQVLRHPAYPSQIVDTIGAGDTFFSFACLLAALGKPVEFLPIPALAASLSTTWLCNEKSVTRESLLEYSKRFDS